MGKDQDCVLLGLSGHGSRPGRQHCRVTLEISQGACARRRRSLQRVLCLALVFGIGQTCSAWWVGSDKPAECPDDDRECLIHDATESASQAEGSKDDLSSETLTLPEELALLRAEVLSLRSELKQKHQITESLAGALQELRLERHASKSECRKQCETMQKGQTTSTSSNAANDEQDTRVHSGAKIHEGLELNGFEEDKEGQMEWIYGIPRGKRNIVIELGANNGEWISQFLQAHTDFWPIIVEAQPTFKDELRDIARNYGGVYIQAAAWVTEGEELTFHAHTDAGGMGSSLFGDSVYSDGFCDGDLNCEQSKAETYKVTTIDVVRLIQRMALPDDFIVLRMDIEGAEYQVARRLILSGVGCWVNHWEFEGHAMYAEQNYKYRPVDGVLPWLVRGCGVHMNVYQYYRADPKLRQLRERLEAEDRCAWVRLGVDGCSEAGSCAGITDTDPAS